MTNAPVTTNAPTGVIHDLAYRRYEGKRLGTSTRFLVIARYAVRAQWRLRAVKIFLLGALLFAGMFGVALGFKLGLSRLFQGAGEAIRIHDREGVNSVVSYALSAQYLPSLLLVLVCGAPVVAADLNAGAFQFHFARPVSAGQYLAGRMLAAVAWAAVFGYATLGIYCVEAIGFGSDLATAAKLLGVGALGVTARVVTLGAVALGCSSLTRRKGLAQAMFIAVVLGSGMVSSIVARSTRRPWVSGVSVMDASSTVSEQLLGVKHLEGVTAFAPSLALALWVAGALAVAWVRVSRAEVVRG